MATERGGLGLRVDPTPVCFEGAHQPVIKVAAGLRILGIDRVAFDTAYTTLANPLG